MKSGFSVPEEWARPARCRWSFAARLEPAMSEEERQALGQSAEILRQAVQRTSQIT